MENRWERQQLGWRSLNRNQTHIAAAGLAASGSAGSMSPKIATFRPFIGGLIIAPCGVPHRTPT